MLKLLGATIWFQYFIPVETTTTTKRVLQRHTEWKMETVQTLRQNPTSYKRPLGS